MPELFQEPVLPTMHVDGTRRWLRPRLSPGRFWRRRRVVAYALLALFTGLPYVRVGGHPAVLLDVPGRRFTLLGTTFLATDAALLALFLVGAFLAIFLLTALLGRVWCGWACPQTVYLEFVYRPLERALPRRPLLRNAVFLLVSSFVAHTFLAYFVGVDALLRWVRQSPLQHPVPFLVMAATTALMFLDFAWFREQVCQLACPYGRFQSALLDRHSLLVGYDARRGEPRAPLKSGAGEAAGDCIDCGACVRTCPAGIDIRQGFQMECLHCTQCIDACDAIMDRVGKPPGLVRYGSRADFAGEPRRLLRPRLVVYPALVLAVWGLLGLRLAARQPAEVTVLRGLGVPFLVQADGSVQGAIRVKVVNREDVPRAYTITLAQAEGVRLLAPENPVRVGAGDSGTASVYAIAPRGTFGREGRRPVTVRVSDGHGFAHETRYLLLGPVTP
jgi:cytochrome c oxidase accessory protein FixG